MATDQQKVWQLAQHDGSCPPEQFNGLGEVREPNCNDVMRIYILVNPRCFVVDSAFTISEGACATVRAAAAAAAALAKEKPVLAAYTITAADIAGVLSDDGVLDKEHLHCALMAELALKRAVIHYSTQGRTVAD